MHEYSNQTESTWPLYFLQRFFPKKIFVYIHGQSLNQPPKNPRIVPTANKTTMLVWHEINIPLVKSMGYNNLHVIGMTKFYSEWLSCLDKYNQNKVKNLSMLRYYIDVFHIFPKLALVSLDMAVNKKFLNEDKKLESSYFSLPNREDYITFKKNGNHIARFKDLFYKPSKLIEKYIIN